jgi:hypothetical protein
MAAKQARTNVLARMPNRTKSIPLVSAMPGYHIKTCCVTLLK